MSKSSTNDKWRMARFRPAMDFSKVGSFLRSVLCGKGGNKDNQKVGCAGQSWPILCIFGRQKYEIWMIIYYTSIMYVQAKMVLGLSSATKAEELDSEDIHKKFISKLALVISRIRN